MVEIRFLDRKVLIEKEFWGILEKEEIVERVEIWLNIIVYFFYKFIEFYLMIGIKMIIF